ncbi:MAG TPA: hypothetical protein VMI56_16805 [Reyranella sp.]|nr:hypothetical protein [Reyranella sp.]
MEPTYLADITEKDYAAFFRLPGNEFPNTFNLWWQGRQNQVALYSEGGGKIVFVKAYADEFARYCAARGSAHDANAFSKYIYEKGRGKI